MRPLRRTAVGLAALCSWAAGAAAEPWIKWDRASERTVSLPGERGAAYGRARQLANGDLLLTYHHGETLGNCGSRVAVRRSRDGGATWGAARQVEGPEQGFWGFTNPELCNLGGGRVLLVSAARGQADPADSVGGFLSECRTSGLRLRFSDDGGATWGPPRAVAAGRGRVWEPAVARLPGGGLELFYAIESPALMTDGSSQCIEAVRSADGGRTWGAPRLVARRAGCRMGMPAPLVLDGGRVLCGYEAVGAQGSPFIVDATGGRGGGGAALVQDRYGFGGGPFLARAPDGGTLLVFHSQCRQTPYLRQQPGSWLFSDIFVQRGDARASSFGPASCPWPTENRLAGAYFPSVVALADGGLGVLASFISVGADGRADTSVRWIKGRLTGAR